MAGTEGLHGEEGLTVEVAMERFENLQTQISKIAKDFDSFRIDMVSRIPLDAQEIQQRFEFITERLDKIGSGSPYKSSRWDWRKLNLDKYSGHKPSWRSFSFSIKSFVRREAPKYEQILNETEFLDEEVDPNILASRGVPAGDDAEFYYMLTNYTSGEAKEFVQLRQSKCAVEVWRQLRV